MNRYKNIRFFPECNKFAVMETESHIADIVYMDKKQLVFDTLNAAIKGSNQAQKKGLLK